MLFRKILESWDGEEGVQNDSTCPERWFIYTHIEREQRGGLWVNCVVKEG